MSAPGGRYSRVYWSVIDDEKFSTVWGSDRDLAAWLRLLILADMAWPASAMLPAVVDHDAVKNLAEVGLVDVLPGSRYRIHGLDAERTTRAEQSRAAAHTRWNSRGTAPAMRPHMQTQSLAEQSKEEKSREEQDDDALDDWYRLTGSWPSPKVSKWIGELARDFGPAQVSQVLGQVFVEDDDRSTLLSRTSARLQKAEHDRRKAAEKADLARAAREREEIASMPEEVRRENMERLRRMLDDSGLRIGSGRTVPTRRGEGPHPRDQEGDPA